MQNDGRLIRSSLLWPPGLDIGSPGKKKKSAGPPVCNSLECLKKKADLVLTLSTCTPPPIS